MILKFQRLSPKFRLTIGVLIAMFLVVAQVSAARMFCRSDPIMFLSNGIRLQAGITVETSLADLISIRYEVHVPANVKMDHVIFTPKWAKDKETVVLIADQPANSYKIFTVVRTGTPNVPATINSMKWGNGDGLTRKSATGVSGQVIAISY